MTVEKVSTRCCVAGGGPAGMMLGLLLAHAGHSFNKPMISGRFTRKEAGRLPGVWLSA